ncbi:MAG: SBBP repeat-containing protein [Acidobacteria bacterium]|nr:SBBP repeat-containing protein [Acidobacteriota bacterium]
MRPGFLAVLIFVIVWCPSVSAEPPQAAQARLIETYGKLPLSFEANQGQAGDEVKFLSRGSGYTLFLSSNDAVLSLNTSPDNGKHDRSTLLRVRFVGTNPAATVLPLNELPGRSNYFIGNNQAQWRTGISTYAKVKYEELYPGIDLVFYGNQRQLEYDFIVAPGADPQRIKLAIEGAEKLQIDPQGDLVLHTSGGEVLLRAPVIYQPGGAGQQPIPGGYVLDGEHQLGFQLSQYDTSKPLVIDPVLVYTTNVGLGGGLAIAVDASGSAYVTGWGVSVAKLNPAGSALVYSTYLHAGGNTRGTGIALDSSGNAYVTGFTDSTDFPTLGPLQATPGGSIDAFVAKLNPAGSLVYSTYLGGGGRDSAADIAVDSSGNAYVTGGADSTNFPTANPLQATLGGSADAFIAKLNATGFALVYSTYFGGGGYDSAAGIAVDSSGNAYVTGATASTNFPTANPLQATLAGPADAFIAKLNATGSALVYSTYLGGSKPGLGGNASNGGFGIAVDISGNAYVIGGTGSTNFPTMNPFQGASGGITDAFVAKLNPAGSALVYSTYLGGEDGETGKDLAVDASGNA